MLARGRHSETVGTEMGGMYVMYCAPAVTVEVPHGRKQYAAGRGGQRDQPRWLRGHFDRRRRQALECLRAGTPPDLMPLDMLLDDGDGWSVLSGMRKIPALAGIPVLIGTGLGIAHDEWAESLG